MNWNSFHKETKILFINEEVSTDFIFLPTSNSQLPTSHFYSYLTFSDVVWASIAGFLMTWMYKGRIGKVAGIFAFLEEIIPFTDVIPSFTFTWIYNYWIKKKG